MSADEALLKRLLVRGRFHQLLTLIEDMKSGSTSFDATKLSQIMNEGNELLEQVDRPYECSLDVSVVKGVAERMLEGSSELSTNLRDFNAEEFGSRLTSFIDVGESEAAGSFAYVSSFALPFYNWSVFGRSVASKMRLPCAPLIHHSIDRTPKAAELSKRKRRRSPSVAEAAVSIRTAAVQGISKEADCTTHACELMYNRLKKEYRKNNKEPINFFRFMLHPTKFSITVENLFYLSFLVQDELVSIIVRGTSIGLVPLKRRDRLEKDDENDQTRASHGSVPKPVQSVLTLSVKEWKILVRKYCVVKA